MLHRPIEGVVYGDDGRVVAVKASDPDDPEGAIKDVKCKMVIGDPTYFPDKVGPLLSFLSLLGVGGNQS